MQISYNAIRLKHVCLFASRWRGSVPASARNRIWNRAAFHRARSHIWWSWEYRVLTAARMRSSPSSRGPRRLRLLFRLHRHLNSRSKHRRSIRPLVDWSKTRRSASRSRMSSTPRRIAKGSLPKIWSGRFSSYETKKFFRKRFLLKEKPKRVINWITSWKKLE